MKLDHTFIAIRERGILEICDLALHVVRDHFRPLVVLLFLGALPWVAVDWLLTRWMVVGDFGSEYEGLYYWIMSLLVISQAQVGSTFVTYYLGQAMFVGRPGIWETIRGDTQHVSVLHLGARGITSGAANPAVHLDGRRRPRFVDRDLWDVVARTGVGGFAGTRFPTFRVRNAAVGADANQERGRQQSQFQTAILGTAWSNGIRFIW